MNTLWRAFSGRCRFALASLSLFLVAFFFFRVVFWLLFRELATLSTAAPITQHAPGELRWQGVPRPPFEALVEELAAPALRGRELAHRV